MARRKQKQPQRPSFAPSSTSTPARKNPGFNTTPDHDDDSGNTSAAVVNMRNQRGYPNRHSVIKERSEPGSDGTHSSGNQTDPEDENGPVSKRLKFNFNSGSGLTPSNKSKKIQSTSEGISGIASKCQLNTTPGQQSKDPSTTHQNSKQSHKKQLQHQGISQESNDRNHINNNKEQSSDSKRQHSRSQNLSNNRRRKSYQSNPDTESSSVNEDDQPPLNNGSSKNRKHQSTNAEKNRRANHLKDRHRKNSQTSINNNKDISGDDQVIPGNTSHRIHSNKHSSRTEKGQSQSKKINQSNAIKNQQGRSIHPSQDGQRSSSAADADDENMSRDQQPIPGHSKNKSKNQSLNGEKNQNQL